MRVLVFATLSVCSLTSLSELNVSVNDLEELPVSIGLLRNLRTFYADENFLSFVPSEVNHSTLTPTPSLPTPCFFCPSLCLPMFLLSLPMFLLSLSLPPHVSSVPPHVSSVPLSASPCFFCPFPCFFCPSLCLPMFLLSLSLSLSVCLCLSLSLSVCLCLCLCPSLHPSIRPSLSLSLSSLVPLFLFHSQCCLPPLLWAPAHLDDFSFLFWSWLLHHWTLSNSYIHGVVKHWENVQLMSFLWVFSPSLVLLHQLGSSLGRRGRMKSLCKFPFHWMSCLCIYK